MEHISNIQELLFENSTKLVENDYIQIQNELQQLYNVLNTQTNPHNSILTMLSQNSSMNNSILQHCMNYIRENIDMIADKYIRIDKFYKYMLQECDSQFIWHNEFNVQEFFDKFQINTIQYIQFCNEFQKCCTTHINPIEIVENIHNYTKHLIRWKIETLFQCYQMENIEWNNS